jgi:hypothetical protein
MLPKVSAYLMGRQTEGLNPVLVEQWKAYLGGTRLMSQSVQKVANIPGLIAWRGGSDTPSLVINTNSTPANFITITMPPQSVAMHPSPKAGVAVAWKSPISGRIEIRGKVADADDKCGNGIEWVINRRLGAAKIELAKGDIGNGAMQVFPQLATEVEAAEMLELIVLPKGEYSCDTTLIQLEISGAGKTWNLTRELVANPLAGNPHSGIWYFYDLSSEPVVAPGSTLARFLETRNEENAQAVQRSLQAIAELKENEIPPLDLAVYREMFSDKGPFVSALKGDESAMPAGLRQKVTAVRAEMASLRKITSAPIPIAHGLQDGGCPETPYVKPQDVKIHLRGRYDRLGKTVPRGVPAILGGPKVGPIKSGSGRLQLAQWLASKENPQTARVMANRIWQHHFGEGLVRTPNNFGHLGTPASHPQLLDYLAIQFMNSGWSIKAMHRMMMLSATYQQSSLGDPATVKADPENILLGRMPRRRLDAEELRDSLLAVSGGLDGSLGGPAVKELTSPRRSLYLLMVRSDRSNYRMLFDAPDPNSMAEKRIDSTVAPQALFLLNHPFALERTKALARLSRQRGRDTKERVNWLYQTLYARPAEDFEVRLADSIVVNPNEEGIAWESYCQVLLCSNEFIYVD